MHHPCGSGFDLSPPSTSVSSDFMVLCNCLQNYTYFTLPCRGFGLVRLAGGLTKCCPSVLATVGWVIWPVKIVPDMTYNVFGGTLNPTLLLLPCGKFGDCSFSSFGSIVQTNRHADRQTLLNALLLRLSLVGDSNQRMLVCLCWYSARRSAVQKSQCCRPPTRRLLLRLSSTAWHAYSCLKM